MPCEGCDDRVNWWVRFSRWSSSDDGGNIGDTGRRWLFRRHSLHIGCLLPWGSMKSLIIFSGTWTVLSHLWGKSMSGDESKCRGRVLICKGRPWGLTDGKGEIWGLGGDRLILRRGCKRWRSMERRDSSIGEAGLRLPTSGWQNRQFIVAAPFHQLIIRIHYHFHQQNRAILCSNNIKDISEALEGKGSPCSKDMGLFFDNCCMSRNTGSLEAP